MLRARVLSRLFLAAGLVGVLLGCELPADPDVDVVEVTDYSPPKDDDTLLVDDVLDDKKTTFDPELVDSRPEGDWQVNLSDAVLKLDVPIVAPDRETHLLTLYPSYADAKKNAPTIPELLPSVNMLDGKAKQFDDGLYAALDQAYYKGLESTLPSHVAFVRRLFDKVDPTSPAAPFLAAGLELAGTKVEVKDATRKARWLSGFERNPAQSKPIGFYTWNPTLSDCFRFLRFFQKGFGASSPELKAIAAAIDADADLKTDYQKSLAFYAKLTNPYASRNALDLLGSDNQDDPRRPFCLFPPSTSRETELFEKLFPNGLPPDANLMREMITAIRDGSVSLTPKPDSGWYDYQVSALETLLLPEKGAEKDKLMLTKSYKKRMLDAFKALMTKRRETHSRQLKTAEAPSAAPMPVESFKPRLRLEPAPTYYLRTARSYNFLLSFLDSTVGEASLASLHGLREDRPQEADLRSELAAMRDMFYGFYLLSAEDLGMKPAFLDGESVDRDACVRAATTWLADPFTDPDMKRDTRVSVPVFVDGTTGKIRLWTTLGVRLTKLDASYARPPRVRPKDGSKEWEVLRPDQLEGTSYFIPVDEFAEVETTRVYNREELRALCDRMKTKEAIVKELSR